MLTSFQASFYKLDEHPEEEGNASKLMEPDLECPDTSNPSPLPEGQHITPSSTPNEWLNMEESFTKPYGPTGISALETFLRLACGPKLACFQSNLWPVWFPSAQATLLERAAGNLGVSLEEVPSLPKESPLLGNWSMWTNLSLQDLGSLDKWSPKGSLSIATASPPSLWIHSATSPSSGIRPWHLQNKLLFPNMSVKHFSASSNVSTLQWEVCRTQVCWWCQSPWTNHYFRGVGAHHQIGTTERWRRDHKTMSCPPWFMPTDAGQTPSMCILGIMILQRGQHLQCQLKWQQQENPKCNVCWCWTSAGSERLSFLWMCRICAWCKDAVAPEAPEVGVEYQSGINLCQFPSQAQSVS